MLRYGIPLSSHVVKGVSGLLLGSGGELGLFLEVQQGSETLLHVVRGNLGVSIGVASRESGLISS